MLVALAAGIWGTVLRPPAYEVRGEVLARPTPSTLLLRHEAVGGLGMGPMELMAVWGAAPMLDESGVQPGDRVRLAVRQQGDQIIVLRIERLR
jgi:hypothetical protein